MPTTLSKEYRNALAKVTAAARIRAESACKAALENLAVHEKDYRSHMSLEQRQLRNQLRARGRALGDRRDERLGTQEIRHLAEAAAYEHWHRLLFTRFLAVNNLLHTDVENGNVPVTLQDCEELAPELEARDGFELACRFAAKTLPGVFRSDDPVLSLRLAINDEVELKKLLDSLPGEVFTADDSLGWTYQFWQAQLKDEVNKSGKKIGADELSPVTQLFTEDYMVEFLLHNTLGAWYAGKLGPISAGSEEEARSKAALSVKYGLGVNWTYLRFIQDESTKTWTPAAGTFSGWPTEAKHIRFLDPCMGSGHFLVFALPLIARLRMEEEGLTAAQAIEATLTDNMFGLELDERCSQIAAFNLALTGWKLGGYQTLPSLHLACSGIAPRSSVKDWVALAGDDERLKNGMIRLHELFKDAPVLGSLINPRRSADDMFIADYHELQPLLEKALAEESKDDTAHEMVVTARGLTKAAEILAGQFTLVATNVPYLGRGKQDETLQDYCERYYPESKADLATCFVERCLEFCSAFRTVTLVTPQQWLSQFSYTRFRKRLFQNSTLGILGHLGSGAFETITGEVVNVVLFNCTRSKCSESSKFAHINATNFDAAPLKAKGLISEALGVINQSEISRTKDCFIRQTHANRKLLEDYVRSYQGIKSGDDGSLTRLFWELPAVDLNEWAFEQGTTSSICSYSGREKIIHTARQDEFARFQGKAAWDKRGVIVNQMGGLFTTSYTGEWFDGTVSCLVPNAESDLPAVWTFCLSSEYSQAVRVIESGVAVSNAILAKVPFNLDDWQKVAAEKYPHGLPKPFSSDPTQWLFNGHPAGADQPLHVAVARLLGYQWPRQTGSSFPDCPALGPDGLEKLADNDGIVCLPPINREHPAANRLRGVLVQALGQFDERALIATAGKKGSKSTTLEDWLREEFFEQHCDLFHNRPFIWHVWDGRKDGFHALVNYHRLDHAKLQKLTYSYLGDWIRQQEEDAKAEKPGADARLGAARVLQSKLAKILEGDAPFDIFVRWKPITEQATGWNPDINDGVRMNIRPFATSDILRKRVKIKWEKDRGKEPHRDKAEYPWFWCEEEPNADPSPGKDHTGHRWNNVHLSLAAKSSRSK